MSPDKIAGLRQRIKGGGGLNRVTPEKHRQPAQNRDSEQSPDALPSGGLVAHPGVQSHLVRCHGCFQRFGWEASAILGVIRNSLSTTRRETKRCPKSALGVGLAQIF